MKLKKAVKHLKKGSIFIYPSDTRYCLGCNALDSDAMKRLSMIKQDLALTVVAPSKKWIESNFTVKKAFLDKLPGTFHLYLKIKESGYWKQKHKRHNGHNVHGK